MGDWYTAMERATNDDGTWRTSEPDYKEQKDQDKPYRDNKTTSKDQKGLEERL